MGVHLACASKVYHSAHLTPHLCFRFFFFSQRERGRAQGHGGLVEKPGPVVATQQQPRLAGRTGESGVREPRRCAPVTAFKLHCYERACCKEGLQGRVCQRRVAYDKGRLTREAVPFAGSMDDRDILNIFAKTPNFVSKARQSNPARFFPSFPVRARACSEGVGR